MVLCEAAFPKKLAFAYLEDLHSEFDEQHGKKVPTVSRPYSFIEFGKFSPHLCIKRANSLEKLFVTLINFDTFFSDVYLLKFWVLSFPFHLCAFE